MPGADASEITRFKKFRAIQTSEFQNSGKKNNKRNEQYVRRLPASRLFDFLPSVSKRYLEDEVTEEEIVSGVGLQMVFSSTKSSVVIGFLSNYLINITVDRCSSYTVNRVYDPLYAPSKTYYVTINNPLSDCVIDGLAGVTAVSGEGQGLTSFNLSTLTDLEIVVASYTNLTAASINSSKISPTITTLICENNNLAGLNLTGFPNLKILRLNDSNLTGILNLSMLSNLEEISCRTNPNLQGIIITGLTKLRIYECLENAFTDTVFDFTAFPDLEKLSIGGGNIGANSITRLNVSGLLKLEKLEIYYSNSLTFTNLNITNLPNLKNLFFTYARGLNGVFNALVYPKLETLGFVTAGLTGIIINGLTKLRQFYCADIPTFTPTSFDLTAFPDLETVFIQGINLTGINVSGLLKLKYFNFYNNNIVRANMNISNLPNLIQFDSSGNPVGGGTLDLSVYPKLQYIGCSSCNLSNIDITGLLDLVKLICSYNLFAISSLDLTSFTKLEILQCSALGLNFSNINITGLTKLKQINCENNKISTADMNTILRNLPNRTGLTAGTCTVNPQTPALGTLDSVTAKNWVVS